jgi:dTDP-4-amino-4,6-dideoxygalactose transaminase
VFVDIGRDTLGMSPDSLESWLKANTVVVAGDCYYQPQQGAAVPDVGAANQPGLKRISACVPMHTFGHPCQIDKIVAICDRYHIPVVEDSAESIGSYYKDQHTGTFGKLGIFSFNGNKTITTGGGGMVVTDDDELGPLAKHITTTAKKPHPWRFEHDRIGYNYRLPNINAALGCAQMEKLREILKNKRETAMAYQSFFSDYSGIEFIDEPRDCVSNFWLNAILLKDVQARESFLKETNENRVMSRPAWILMNELQMYKDCIAAYLPVSQEISDRLVNIPSSVR